MNGTLKGDAMSQTLLVEDLHKRFGSGRRLVWANDGITMSVNAGEVVGLLGHNGAGKTTLVNQIVGLYRPYSGRIAVDGVDVVADPAAARRLVSVQAQENVPITGISPRKAVELVGRIRGGRRSAMRQRAKGLIDALDMGEWADRPAEKVSGGVARLSAFAMAVARPGALVVLDEPTNDVDPVRRQLLWDEVRRVADDGAAVLLVTHNVREAERILREISHEMEYMGITHTTLQLESSDNECDGELICEVRSNGAGGHLGHSH